MSLQIKKKFLATDVIDFVQNTAQTKADAAEAAAKSYTDTEIEAVELAFQAADELLSGRLDVLEGSGEGSLAAAISGLEDAIADEESRAMGVESGLDGRLVTAEGDIDALEGRMDTAEDDIDAVEGRATALEGRATALEGRASDLETDVGVLKGNSSVSGSVDQKVKSAIDALVNGADGAFDTLKEIADWIASDETAVSNITSQLGDHESRLETIEGDGVGSIAKALVDAKAYADAEVLIEKGRAEGAEAGLQAAIDAVHDYVFHKGGKTLVSDDITAGYFDLSHQIVAASLNLFADRLALHEGEDFNLSVVSGKTRVSFIGSVAAGQSEELVAGDKLKWNYVVEI